MTSNVPLSNRIKEVLEFFRTGIWLVETKDQPVFKRSIICFLKIVSVTMGGLSMERIQLRASSLTFYSLLSIVPVLAMVFGLAKGFGLEKLVEKELLARVQGQEEIFTRMIGFAQNLLESTQGGLIAGAGVLVLFWSVVGTFGNIEKSFNEIWRVSTGRTLIRKTTDYLSLALFCAVLAAASSALTVIITSEATFMVTHVKALEVIGPGVFLILKLLPLVAIWALFILIYAAIPNTQVKFTSATFGGIIAGTAFQIFQRLCIVFQIGVAKYNVIYGSFAALPLFLVWLQTSWLIVLLGARLSFACQNLDYLQHESNHKSYSQGLMRLLALLIVSLVLKRFSSEEGAAGEKDMSRELKIPSPIMKQLLEKLVACRVLSKIDSDGSEEAHYQPRIDPERLTILLVISRLDALGENELKIADSESFFKLSRCVEQFREILETSPGNVLLKNI